MTEGGLIDGKPVRDVGICEKIFERHEEISKKFIQDSVAKGIPEELAILWANEMKLYHRQMILGRNFDERPAFMPEEEWNKYLASRSTPKKPRGSHNSKQKKEVRLKKYGRWV